MGRASPSVTWHQEERLSEIVETLTRYASDIWGLFDPKSWAVIVPVAVISVSLVAVLAQSRLASGKSADRLGFTDPLAWLRSIPVLYEHLMHPWRWATSNLMKTDDLQGGQLIYAFRAGTMHWGLYRVPLRRRVCPQIMTVGIWSALLLFNHRSPNA